MKKSVSFIGSVGVPARYGGFETLVEQICLKTSKIINITVYCSSKAYTKNERKTNWNKVERKFIPLKANGLQSILYDSISILKSLKKTNTLVILGGSATIFLPFFLLFFKNKNIIFHPDGKDWSRKKWNKLSQLYLFLSVKAGCRAASSIIIDNKALFPLYTKYKHKLKFISYGGDQYSISHNKQHIKDSWLTIARAEPENNLKLIADTFKKYTHVNWILITNYTQTKFGRKLEKELTEYPNIKLIQANYSKEEIQKHLNQCKGYIHGHSMGGTNPSLTIAMWLNKPILCHDNNFNRTTTNQKALFFKTKEELYEIITSLQYVKNNATTNETYNFAKSNYNWDKIANEYLQII